MHLLIMMGPPAAGKSSIIRELVPQLPPKTIHVQTDAIRFLIPSPSYSTEESIFVYDTAHQISASALQAGYVTILDATFVNPEELQRAHELSKRRNVPITVAHITVPLDEALLRNKARQGSARINEEALRRIWSGLDGTHVPGEIRIDTTTVSPPQAASRILDIMRAHNPTIFK